MPMKSGGKGAKSGDVRAGGAFVEVSAKDNISKPLEEIKRRAQSLVTSIRNIGKGLALAGGLGLAPAIAFFKGGVDRAVQIDRMAKALGFSVEQMQRLAFAADVAGVSIDDVLKNPERFADLMADAPLMDAKTIRESVQASRDWKRSIIEIQTALAPAISLFAGLVRGVAEFIRNNPKLIQAMAVAAVGAVALGTALMLVTSPFVAIPLLIAGAVAAFVRFTAAGRKMGAEFGETLGAIMEAIQRGDIEGAMKVLGAGLNLVWKSLLADLTFGWVMFKEAIVDTFRNIVTGWKAIINEFSAWLMRNDPTGLLSGDLTDEQINRARDEINAELGKENRRAKDEAAAFRRKQIDDAQKELDAARNALKGKIDEVKKAGLENKIAPGQLDIRPQIESVRGGFRLLDQSQLQFGEGTKIPKLQLEMGKKQVEELQKLNRGVEQIGKGLRFK